MASRSSGGSSLSRSVVDWLLLAVSPVVVKHAAIGIVRLSQPLLLNSFGGVPVVATGYLIIWLIDLHDGTTGPESAYGADAAAPGTTDIIWNEY